MAKTKKVKPLQGESEDIQNTIKEAVEKEEAKPLIVKEHEAKPLKVKTPYPKDHKKADVDFIGEELVKLSNRLNEIELSVSDISIQLKQVRSRMGLI